MTTNHAINVVFDREISKPNDRNYSINESIALNSVSHCVFLMHNK